MDMCICSRTVHNSKNIGIDSYTHMSVDMFIGLDGFVCSKVKDSEAKTC